MVKYPTSDGRLVSQWVDSVPSIAIGFSWRSGEQLAVFECGGRVKCINLCELLHGSEDVCEISMMNGTMFSTGEGFWGTEEDHDFMDECLGAIVSNKGSTILDYIMPPNCQVYNQRPFPPRVYSTSLGRWVDAVISEEIIDGSEEVMVQYQDPVTGACRKRMSIRSENLDVGGRFLGGVSKRSIPPALPVDGIPSDEPYGQNVRKEALSQGSDPSTDIEECDPGGVSLPDPTYLLRAPPPSQQEMYRQAQQNYLQRPHWDVHGRQRQIEASRADSSVAGGRAGLGVERRFFGQDREEELRRQRRQMRSIG